MRVLQTSRLLLSPVSDGDLADLTALKSSPASFSDMLGGLRSAEETRRELAEEKAFWKENGIGMFALRLKDPRDVFVGMAGLHRRFDGWDLALRFSLLPEFQGKGLAFEAAAAVLQDAAPVVGQAIRAIVRQDNRASRLILERIGMTEKARFMRDGALMLVYEAEAART